MEAASALSAWESFYVIVGSSGAALTGLQFVVIALVADTKVEGGPGEIAAFGTPTVVHFGAVLLFSAVLSAPWATFSSPGIVLAVSGAAGIIYAAIITVRSHRTGYRPVLEDWIWHAILPFIAYSGTLVAGVLVARQVIEGLFLVAAMSLVLLFIGIHNAWDTVTYIALKPAAAAAPKTELRVGE